jgi:hypothetical protein
VDWTEWWVFIFIVYAFAVVCGCQYSIVIGVGWRAIFWDA